MSRRRNQNVKARRLVKGAYQARDGLLDIMERAEVLASIDWEQRDNVVAVAHFSDGETSGVKLDTLVRMVREEYLVYAVYTFTIHERATLAELLDVLAAPEEVRADFAQTIGDQALDEYIKQVRRRLQDIGFDMDKLDQQYTMSATASA